MQKNKLYVGNIPWGISEEELKNFVAAVGDVVSVKIIEGKGFGFVEMSSSEDAERVKTELNGKELQGRPLRIDDARPPKPRREFGGGDGGFKRY